MRPQRRFSKGAIWRIISVMENRRFLAIIAFTILAPVTVISVTPPGNARWNRVSSFQFDVAGKTIAVVLENPVQEKVHGTFSRIRIRTPGEKEFVLNHNDTWVRYRSPEAEIASRLQRRKNDVPSDYVLASKVSNDRILLFLFGYAYASSPGSLHIIEISPRTSPRVVLHKGELGLKEIRDLDADGVAEVIGYPCLSQEFGNGWKTYDPFHVYVLPSGSDGTAHLSTSLSKSYNLKHYYGWAGPDCSEKTVVVLHPPNGDKPVVVSIKDAEKMSDTGR